MSNVVTFLQHMHETLVTQYEFHSDVLYEFVPSVLSHLVMATEFLWVLYPLLILPSVDAAHSHKDPQGIPEIVQNYMYITNHMS